MPDRRHQADQIIKNLLHVWMQDPQFKPLVKAVRKNRTDLTDEIASILEEAGKRSRETSERTRSYVLRYALERIQIDFQIEHFVLFKEVSVVESVLEYSFDVQPGKDFDSVIFPYQEEVVKIIARCLYPDHKKDLDIEDVTSFLQLFFGSQGIPTNSDKTRRYKSMVWFAYLLVELLMADPIDLCKEGVSHLKTKLKTLLQKAMEGRIINEDRRSPEFDCEGGKWNKTLFGGLQGDDNQLFLQKLRQQFNLDERSDHANRLLSSKHRECMYRQVISLLC